MTKTTLILTLGSDNEADAAELAYSIASYLKMVLPDDFGYEDGGRADGYEGPFLRSLRTDVRVTVSS